MLALGEQTANGFEGDRLERPFLEDANGDAAVTALGPDAVPRQLRAKTRSLDSAS